ncbi:MAG: DUF1934 domain-containing protein [Clostridium sp.]
MKTKFKKVLITVKTTQSFEEEVEDVELVTEGRFATMDGFYLGEYDESEISGMKGTKTSIKIYNDSVTLIRAGSTNSNLVFKLGGDHISLYGTKHGAFEVIVKTKKISINIDETGGVIDLDYIIETQGVNVSNNKLKLTIKEVS